MKIIVKNKQEYKALLEACQYIHETQSFNGFPILNFLAGIYDSEPEIREQIVSEEDHDSLVYWGE